MHESRGRRAVKWTPWVIMMVETCALPVPTVRAQAGSTGETPTVAASQTQTQSEETGLTEIVVTARKRTENLQSIPESIEALGDQTILDAHVTRIDDLGNLVSNLNITTRADNTPDVVLRGIGSFGVVSGVGFYVDDVQLFDGHTVAEKIQGKVANNLAGGRDLDNVAKGKIDVGVHARNFGPAAT